LNCRRVPVNSPRIDRPNLLNSPILLRPTLCASCSCLGPSSCLRIGAHQHRHQGSPHASVYCALNTICNGGYSSPLFDVVGPTSPRSPRRLFPRHRCHLEHVTHCVHRLSAQTASPTCVLCRCQNCFVSAELIVSGRIIIAHNVMLI